MYSYNLRCLHLPVLLLPQHPHCSHFPPLPSQFSITSHTCPSDVCLSPITCPDCTPAHRHLTDCTVALLADYHILCVLSDYFFVRARFMRTPRKEIRGDVEFPEASQEEQCSLHVCGENSPLLLRVPLPPVRLGVGNCSLAAKREERANSGADLVVAVIIGRYWCSGGESVVCNGWIWYCGRGCESGGAGRQEDECEDCDGEWVMCLHGEGYLGSGMESRKFVVVSSLSGSKQQKV